MALKVTYENPAFEKDQEFDIAGIGLVKNGTAKTLSKEEEEAAVAKLGMSVKDFAKGGTLKVEGTTELKAAEVENLTEGGEQ